MATTCHFVSTLGEDLDTPLSEKRNPLGSARVDDTAVRSDLREHAGRTHPPGRSCHFGQAAGVRV